MFYSSSLQNVQIRLFWYLKQLNAHCKVFSYWNLFLIISKMVRNFVGLLTYVNSVVLQHLITYVTVSYHYWFFFYTT